MNKQTVFKNLQWQVLAENWLCYNMRIQSLLWQKNSFLHKKAIQNEF